MLENEMYSCVNIQFKFQQRWIYSFMQDVWKWRVQLREHTKSFSNALCEFILITTFSFPQMWAASQMTNMLNNFKPNLFAMSSIYIYIQRRNAFQKYSRPPAMQ